MTPRRGIHVVCACPPGTNPGMSTVDMALRAVARRNGFLDDLRFLRLWHPAEFLAYHRPDQAEEILARQHSPIAFETLRERLELLDDAAAVVYWGDFLQARDHHADVRLIAQRLGFARDDADAQHFVDRHLLLRDAPDETLARTVLYGGTLIFNRMREYADPAYAPHLQRLVAGSREVLMRDVWSAAAVARMRGDPTRPRLGTDCALLLQPGDLGEMPRTGWSAAGRGTGEVGVFFGRSTVEPKLLGRFARDVADALDCRGRWFPWGGTDTFDPRRDRVRKGFPALQVADGPNPTIGDLVDVLGRFRAVVTDTYHVSVNAWRLGVPAICVGQPTSDEARDISAGHHLAWRDKRQTFFAMYDAMDLYVQSSELADRRTRAARVAHVAAVVRDPPTWQTITGAIAAHRDSAEAELVAVLDELRA